MAKILQTDPGSNTNIFEKLHFEVPPVTCCLVLWHPADRRVGDRNSTQPMNTLCAQSSSAISRAQELCKEYFCPVPEVENRNLCMLVGGLGVPQGMELQYKATHSCVPWLQSTVLQRFWSASVGGRGNWDSHLSMARSALNLKYSKLEWNLECFKCTSIQGPLLWRQRK